MITCEDCKQLNVLLIGSGGREHAIAWKISQSRLLGKLFIAPGNAGTRELGDNLDISPTDFSRLTEIIRQEQISLVIVGPEEPLVKGIREAIESEPGLDNVMIIGPGRRGAMLEGSKDFAKEFMIRHGIPTASYSTFSRESLTAGLDFLKSIKPPYVLKADGLAAGKGVIITEDILEAEAILRAMLIERQFGHASQKVVVEKFLSGIELSVFILTDGTDYILLPEAKDYKRAGNGDTGPNTGGMGSVSPVPFADKEFMKKVQERIIKPTINGLRKDQIPYTGFIFFGLMNVEGDPFVIEYNVRLGDPETESVLPRIQSDLLDIFIKVCMKRIPEIKMQIDPRTAVSIMAVSGGYPGDYDKGKLIKIGIMPADSIAFHAGTTYSSENGCIFTSGGRVIAVTALDSSISRAASSSYSSLKYISFDRMFFREDIGNDLSDQ